MADPADQSARRLVEAAVYAPIGLAVVAGEHFPLWVETRRQQLNQRVVVARIVGKLVVDQGARELRRRLESRSCPTQSPSASPVTASAAASPAARPAPAQPTAARPAPSSTPVEPIDVVDEVDVVDEIVDDGAAGSDPVVPELATLPIEGYDSLAALQVLDRLAGLEPEERAAVAAYEQAHRNRRTILGRIAQLDGRA